MKKLYIISFFLIFLFSGCSVKQLNSVTSIKKEDSNSYLVAEAEYKWFILPIPPFIPITLDNSHIKKCFDTEDKRLQCIKMRVFVDGKEWFK